MHGSGYVGIGCLLLVAWAYGRILHARGPLPIVLRALRHARGPAGLLPTNDQHTHSPNHASNNPFIRASVRTFTHTSIHPFIHPPIRSSTNTSTHIPTHPSIIHIRSFTWMDGRMDG